MKNIFEEFVDRLRSVKKNNKATVVYLWGDLGSGKTTFTKNFCIYLGLNLDITSPTFTILKRYDFNIENFKNLIHIDAYRLDSYDDLLKIKFEEYLNNKENLIFIEWPSIVENKKLKPDINIRFNHTEDLGDRSIKID